MPCLVSESARECGAPCESSDGGFLEIGVQDTPRSATGASRCPSIHLSLGFKQRSSSKEAIPCTPMMLAVLSSLVLMSEAQSPAPPPPPPPCSVLDGRVGMRTLYPSEGPGQLWCSRATMTECPTTYGAHDRRIRTQRIARRIAPWPRLPSPRPQRAPSCRAHKKTMMHCTHKKQASQHICFHRLSLASTRYCAC